MAYGQVASGTVEAAGDGGGSLVAVVAFVLVDDVDFLFVAEPAAGSEVVGGISHRYTPACATGDVITSGNVEEFRFE